MLLCELFQEPPLEMDDELRNSILDVLTPLMAQKVPFVTVDQIIDKLRQFRSGIALDRGFIMDTLDPEKMKAVKSIEGDRIYLNIGGAPEEAKNVGDEQQDIENIHKNAAQQAQKGIASDNTGAPDVSQTAAKQARGAAASPGGAL